MIDSISRMRDLQNLDWDLWRPKERCTLMFIKDNDKILLIHKKTGMGAKLINGPGGKIEEGELPLQAAIRETWEETQICPIGPYHAGTLNFAFDNGYDMQVEVFVAESHAGVAAETDEAVPFWCSIDNIPYDQMWPDDRFWWPLMLDGIKFKCYCKFSGQELIEFPKLVVD